MTKTTISTAHGYTVTAQRVGVEFELTTTNTKGEVISTVTMTDSEFHTLLNQMDSIGSAF